MNKLQCLIIDDEPIARQILRNYCQHFDTINIVAECENAIEAMKILGQKHIDFIFLDIDMPHLSGLDFLKNISNPPLVILTTAYHQYALESYELNVLDYLLKPFSLERFVRAINKIQLFNKPKTNSTDIISASIEDKNIIFIKAEKKIYRLKIEDILYCEAQGNFTKIVSVQNVIEAYISLSKIQKQLPTDYFIRCHRSFIVNKQFIGIIENHRLHLGEIEIPIGNTYRKETFSAIGWKNE